MKDIRVQMVFIMIGMVLGVIIMWFVMHEERERLQNERELIEQQKYCPYCGELLR